MRHAFRSTTLALFLAVIQSSCFTTAAIADEHEYAMDEFLVYAEGNISFRENTTVEGHIGAEGWISMRENAVYTKGNIFADKWVSVQARTTVDGFILSGGNVDLYQDAVIAGGLQVDGRLTAYERSKIHGNVFASGSITLKANAVVTGSVNEYADLSDSWEHPDVDKPKFERGKHDVEVKQDKSKSLDPGEYKTLWMRSGSTLELTAGKYYFHKVQIDKDFTFDIDDSDGKVEVIIDYNMSTGERGEFKVKSGSADGFTLWVKKDISFREDCKFTGNIRGFGTVSLRERTSFEGTIYAEGNFIARENSTFKASKPAKPTVFYVRKRGSDSNDGASASTAFRTIQHAVDQKLKPGSVVYVGPGVYQESIKIDGDEKKDKKKHGRHDDDDDDGHDDDDDHDSDHDSDHDGDHDDDHDDDDDKEGDRSGTASNPIRLVADVKGEFTNDEPGAVVIDGRSHDKEGIKVEKVQHWVIDGFTVRNQKEYGFKIKEAGLSILNCTVDVPRRYGIYAKTGGSVTVADCVFERTTDSMHVMWIQTKKNESGAPVSITVTRNDLSMKGNLYMSTEFEKGHGSFYDRSRRGRRGPYVYGIVVLSSDKDDDVASIEISNNLVSDCYLGLYAAITRTKDAQIVMANNTVVGSFYSTYLLGYNKSKLTNSNNIIDQCYLGTMHYAHSGSTSTVKGILENKITMQMTRYNRSFEFDIITGDPQFVDPASGDFSLAPGSPAIDAGFTYNAPATDIAGRSRPSDGNGDGIAQIDLGVTELVSTGGKKRVRVVNWKEIGNEHNRKSNRKSNRKGNRKGNRQSVVGNP